VQSVQDFGPQFTIAVNLNTAAVGYKPPRHRLGVIIQFISMVARQNVNRSVRRADYVIHPDVDAYSPFDFSAAGELIDLGYRVTREQIDGIKREWRRRSRWAARLKTRLARRRLTAASH